MKKLLLATALFLVIVSANGQNCLDTTTYKGTATYYTYTGIGACGTKIKTDSLYMVALPTAMYDGSNACGSCMEITGDLGKVTVTVADLCPDCNSTNLDLSQIAFAQIGNPISGIINVKWKKVDCPITGNIKYLVSNSSNPWYIDLNVRNMRYAVKKVEFKGYGSSTYTDMARQTYNSFTYASGSQVTVPITFRVTSILDQVIEEQMAFTPGVEITGTKQFPACVNTGVNNPTKDQILVYPNPASEFVFVKFISTLSDNFYTIKNITGQTCLSGDLSSGNESKIDIRNLSKGIYILMIGKHNDLNYKFMVQ